MFDKAGPAANFGHDGKSAAARLEYPASFDVLLRRLQEEFKGFLVLLLCNPDPAGGSYGSIRLAPDHD